MSLLQSRASRTCPYLQKQKAERRTGTVSSSQRILRTEVGARQSFVVEQLDIILVFLAWTIAADASWLAKQESHYT